MDRVRVMLWCTTCVPGMQLPLYAAAASGAFARHGLEVEFVDPVPPRDLTLAGLSVRLHAVAAGAADVAVTGVAYLLAARAEAGGGLDVRFVTTLHQRSPIVGVVRRGSPVRKAGDLAGRVTASHGLRWMVDEYQAALRHHGIDPARLVEADDGPYAARSLERGDVEVSPAWIDTIPSIRQDRAGELRTVPLDVGVYASGLAAADRVPLELVTRLTDAVAEGMERQRDRPALGVDLYNRRYPRASTDDLRLAWSLFEPNAPTADTAPMAADRWAASSAFYARAHALPVFGVDELCRSELVQPTSVTPRSTLV